MDCSPETFRQAMRQFPAAVTIVSTGFPGARVGMTATAVCSLSVEPPQMMICLNRQTGTAQAVRTNGRFSVNVLRTNQSGLARTFAGQDEGRMGETRFDPNCWYQGERGMPILRDSVFSIECDLIQAQEVATHLVIIGAGCDIKSDDDRMALIYRNGGFGTWAPIHT